MHPTHLIPASLTPLIGRETEVTRAMTLLERKEVRLLTLIGPGGVGKTRLRLQMVEDVLDRFEDGVWFVGLASLRDASLVAATIAQTLGLREALAREELALAERIGDESGMGNALAHLGVIAETCGDLLSAARFLEQGVEHCQKAGDIGGIERALLSLGHVFRALGDYVRATQTFEEALEVARSVNLTWAVANVLTSLGHLAREQGDSRHAISWYRESLALQRTFGTKGYIAWSFEGIAMAACTLGQYAQAVRLCAAAEEIRKQAQVPRPPTEQKLYDQTIAAARAALEEERFGRAWTVGRTLSLEDALSSALAESPEE